MAGRLTSITYERDGFPCHLATDREWRDAIGRGSLRPDTRVTVSREGVKDQLKDAGVIPELKSLFDEAAMRSPEGVLAVIRKLVAERIDADLAAGHAAGEELRGRVEAQEKRIATLERELAQLKAQGGNAAAAPASIAPAPRAQAVPEPPAAPPPPPPAGTGAALDDYCRLLQSPAPKPRQFREVFERLGPAGFLETAGPGLFLLGPDHGADALVVGIERGTAFVAVPGFAFVSMFDKAYRSRRDAPPLIAALFDLETGGGLEMKRPAELTRTDGNVLKVTSRGRLVGFGT